MEQEQIAARLGIGLVLSQVGAGVQARLTSDAGIPAPAMIKVALRHPTLKEKDVLLTLHHQGSGVFRGDGVLPASGRLSLPHPRRRATGVCTRTAPLKTAP